MAELFKELEDKGCEIIVGFREKERIKTIRDSLRKIEEDNDKLKYVKTLCGYYNIINILGCIIYQPTDLTLEEDKYFINYLCHYLDNFVESSKWIIADVIKALGNDEQLDNFSKYLLLTSLYTPEEIKELGFEKIIKKEVLQQNISIIN